MGAQDRADCCWHLNMNKYGIFQGVCGAKGLPHIAELMGITKGYRRHATHWHDIILLIESLNCLIIIRSETPHWSRPSKSRPDLTP